jgi:catechol-2,3-dioxygenase
MSKVLQDQGTAEPIEVVRPQKFAHVVLRSRSRYDEMVEWYLTVLNARIVAQAPHMAFLTFDEEHHRIAIVNAPHLNERDPMADGLDHLSFTYGTLADLLATYGRLKTLGIEPFCPVNHGVTTSLYYHDPDRNRVELQIDNFEDLDEGGALLSSMATTNPIGVLFDPDDLAAQLAAGASQDSIVQKTAEEIGPVTPELIEKILAV